MDDAPKLPQHVSPDGKEIWDWAADFSAHIHRRDRIMRLERDIAKIGTRCGDCFNWMKSSRCPREKNINGMSRGPSMGAPVGACPKFQLDPSDAKHRERLEVELMAEKKGA